MCIRDRSWTARGNPLAQRQRLFHAAGRSGGNQLPAGQSANLQRKVRGEVHETRRHYRDDYECRRFVISRVSHSFAHVADGWERFLRFPARYLVATRAVSSVRVRLGRRSCGTPDALRRVSYFDAETNKRLKFLTNNFTLPALTIAQIYKQRWQVELFFKWIKQHLRIKAFYGTSENAVKTQIWIAVSVYVLVAIVRKRLGLEASLYQVLQILSLTLFEKTPILCALQGIDEDTNLAENANQLILFDF